MQGIEIIKFSLMGMMIVFSGLTIISIYIMLLPRLLALPAKLRKMRQREVANEPQTNNIGHGIQPLEKDILTAIAVAFHLDQEFPADDQKMTWRSHGDIDSAWQASGIAHGLAVRNNVHISRRRY